MRRNPFRLQARLPGHRRYREAEAHAQTSQDPESQTARFKAIVLNVLGPPKDGRPIDDA